jgi:hypothetical protein
MQFKTTDGFRIVAKGSGWTDNFVEFSKPLEPNSKPLTLPLFDGWIHDWDVNQVTAFYGSEHAAHNAQSKLDDLDKYNERSFMVHTTDEYDAHMSISECDTSMDSLDDTCTEEPLCGDLNRNDGTWMCSVDEDSEGRLIIKFDANQCDGFEIVALHYPKFDDDRETIISNDGKLTTASYPRREV